MRQKPSLFRRAFLGSIVHGALCVCSAIAVGTLFPARVIASEQPQPESKPRTDSPTWVELVRRTQLSGTPSILVVTSNTVPASKSYVRSLLQSSTVLRLQSQIGVAELSAEDDREQARRLQINTYPTLVAFKRTKAGGLETAGIYRGVLSDDVLSGWILGLGLSQSVVTTSAPTDGVVAASSGGATQPSAGRAPDDHVQRTYYQQPPNPTPQQPIYYPPPPPPVKMAPPAPAPSAPARGLRTAAGADQGHP